MDDKDLLFESVDLFLERVAERRAVLAEAVAAKDPDAFMPVAHTIKGMVGIFSMGDAFEAAKKLEMKGRAHSVEDIEADMADFDAKTDELVEALRAWRAEG